MKIVFFGDSLTQGTYGANYVNKVAAAMRGHHFINQGVNGDTSLNLFRRVDDDVIAHRPDGVFIMIGINDAISNTEPGMRWSYRVFNGVRGGQVTPIAFRENLRATLTRLRVAHIRVWVALPPVEYRPALVERLRQINTHTAELCQEMQIPVLDLMTRFTPTDIPERPPLRALPDMIWPMTLAAILGINPYEKRRSSGGFTYTFDGIHLADQGAQQIAGAVVDFLRANGVSG